MKQSIKCLSGIATMSVLSALISSHAIAEIKMPSFFSDGMVLQQQTSAAIWGWAEPETQVDVSFAGKKMSQSTDARGQWKVVFQGLKASKEGAELTIQIGDETKTIQNVLVGEVWLASGQSNMEWKMGQSTSKDYAKTVDNPLIRHYKGEKKSTAKPQNDFVGTWVVATPETTSTFSGVAFHFAEKLSNELDVPVGIIETAWGGMPIQSFISDQAIRQIPEAAKSVKIKESKVKGYNPAKAEAEYQQNLKAYEIAHQKWIDAGKQGRGPRAPKPQADPNVASGYHSNIYQGMIHPFVGYGMRGAIWYQGERNAGEGKHYGELLEGLVTNWRSLWGLELSFYWVQLANFRAATTQPGQEHGWVDLQDEQRRALKTIPNSGMAVINDIGSAKGIHPGNKKDVGLRLARWALYQDYGQTDVIRSGPLYQSTQFAAEKAIVSFDYAKGLTSRDGEKLARFELAGVDGTWVWGDAVIDGETVIVTAPSVEKATKVRYAWAMNPEGANLVNEVQLPTSCFSSETN